MVSIIDIVCSHVSSWFTILTCIGSSFATGLLIWKVGVASSSAIPSFPTGNICSAL